MFRGSFAWACIPKHASARGPAVSVNEKGSLLISDIAELIGSTSSCFFRSAPCGPPVCSAFSFAGEMGIPGFVQGVGHQVYADYRKRDRKAGEDRHLPGHEYELLGIIEHCAPAHHIGVTQPEKAEASLDQDRAANLKGSLGDDPR